MDRGKSRFPRNALQIRDLLPSLTLRHLWLATPFLLKGFIFPLPLLDVWWHLRMGQYIYENWTIPRVDLFSFTAAGNPFIVQNWLSEIFFYLIYQVGGAALLIFFNSVLLVFLLVPIYCLCAKSSKSFGAILIATCMVSICIPGGIRTQIFSFLLFSVYYWQLMSYRDGDRRWIWLLPVLMVFWVNLHGAFVVGLGLFALFLFCESIRSLSNRCANVLGKKQLAWLALIFLICALATLANPEGFKVYEYILTVMNDPSSQQLVVEWQSPSVSTIQGVVTFYLPFFLLAFVFIASDRKPTFTEIALFAGFSAFGMTAIRNSVWLLLIAAPLIAKYLPSVNWAQLFLHPEGLSETSPTRMPMSKKQSLPMNYVIAVAAFAVLFIQSPWIRQFQRPGSLLESGTPVGVMNFIEKHSLKGNIYHPQIFGDYLIWRLWPGQRSFFDGRVHLFGEALAKFCLLVPESSHWEELLAPYDIRFLLMSKLNSRSGDARMIEEARKSSEWKLLYEDRISVLFEKALSPEEIVDHEKEPGERSGD